MAGTVSGGKAAAATNKLLYGEDYYARIGAIGGKKTGIKGFAVNPELARIAGAKGGKKSRRVKNSEGRAKRARKVQKESRTTQGIIKKLLGIFNG